MEKQEFRWDIFFYRIALIFLVVDWFLYWFGVFDLLAFFSSISICIVFVSLGVALESWRTSHSSDRKMQDISGYLVREKIAILSAHILSEDAYYLNEDFHNRVLYDIDAALSVVDWVPEKLPDLSNATEKLKSKTKQTIDTHRNNPTVGKTQGFYKSLDERVRLIEERKERTS